MMLKHGQRFFGARILRMLIATWNLNNRVGKVRFRPEAASAAIALGADVLVFNEYYPQEHEPTFVRTLHDAG
jgi:hypothetical protein